MDYREKLFSIGKIPMTGNRMEGPPRDREVLAMRALDSALRPLFPPGTDVQVRRSNETHRCTQPGCKWRRPRREHMEAARRCMNLL